MYPKFLGLNGYLQTKCLLVLKQTFVGSYISHKYFNKVYATKWVFKKKTYICF